MVRDNRVPENHFAAFDLLLFLRVGGGFGQWQRTIETVHASNGAEHRLVFDASGTAAAPFEADENWRAQCRAFLEAHYAAGCRTIEDTRRRVLEFFAQSGTV